MESFIAGDSGASGPQLPCERLDVAILPTRAGFAPIEVSLEAESEPAPVHEIEVTGYCDWRLRAVGVDGQPLLDAQLTSHPSLPGSAAGAAGWIDVDTCEHPFGSGFILADGYEVQIVSAPADGGQLEVPLVPAERIRASVDCPESEGLSLGVWGIGGPRPCRWQGEHWLCDAGPVWPAHLSVFRDPSTPSSTLGHLRVDDADDVAVVQCGAPSDESAGAGAEGESDVGRGVVVADVHDQWGRPVSDVVLSVCAPGTASTSCSPPVGGRVGRAVGSSPVSVKVPAGRVEVAASGEGFLDELRTVQVEPDEVVRIELELQAGSPCMHALLGMKAGPRTVWAVPIEGVAWSAGMRAGDQVIEVDGMALPDGAQWLPYLRPGATQRVAVYRPGVGELVFELKCPRA